MPGLDEGGNFGMKTETMKCESSKSTREERVEARSIQSDGQKDASAITNEMIEDYRRRLFRIYLQHAPEHIGKIPDLLQEHGSTKETLDALVARALWEHLAKGSGECPAGYTGCNPLWMRAVTALAAVRGPTLEWDVQRQTRNESYVRWERNRPDVRTQVRG